MQSGVCVVQVGDILPIGSGRMNDAARCIGRVPLGVRRDPWVIPGSVVSNPINDDRNFALVGRINERAKAVQGAEFRINVAVVSHTVG